MLETEAELTSEEMADELQATLDVDRVSVFPDGEGRARVNLIVGGAVTCSFEIPFNERGRPRAEEIEVARRLAHDEFRMSQPDGADFGFE